MPQKTKVDIVRDYVNKMHATYILHYGVELGLFDAISEIPRPFSVSALADKLNYHPPFVSRWCHAAYAIDVLDYVGKDTFDISKEWLDLFLNEESCSYARYLPKCHVKVAEFLPRLRQSMKTGEMYSFDATDDDFIEAVEKDGIRFTNCLIREIIPKLPKFEKLLKEGATLLDIGCGSANNLIALAKHFPKIKCIGIDIAHKNVERAKVNIKNNGFESRISVYQGCASDFTSNQRIDAIIFIESVHEINQPVREAVFQNCNKLLDDNGILMIIDCVGPDDPVNLNKPEYAMAAMVGWFEMDWGSHVPSRDELNQLLLRNNFTEVDELRSVEAVIVGIASKTK